MPFSESVKKDSLERAHYTCVVCRKPGVSLQVHHIKPQGDGGDDTIDNACPLCPTCHADLGGNDEKQKMLREMRDWWWGRCAKQDANPQLVALDKKIAEFDGGFADIKNLLVERTRTLEQLILKSQTVDELSEASGVSLSSIVPIAMAHYRRRRSQ